MDEIKVASIRSYNKSKDPLHFLHWPQRYFLFFNSSYFREYITFFSTGRLNSFQQVFPIHTWITIRLFSLYLEYSMNAIFRLLVYLSTIKSYKEWSISRYIDYLAFQIVSIDSSRQTDLSNWNAYVLLWFSFLLLSLFCFEEPLECRTDPRGK